MADLSNYSVCQSASRIIEITSFQKKTALTDYRNETVSFDDGSGKFVFILMPNGNILELTQTDSTYVYISLSSSTSSAEFWVKLAVSLIDVKGEKQFTQSFGKTSDSLKKENINARFCSRGNILSPGSTYLHNGTLKVLFEIALFKQAPSASLTPLTSDFASLLETGAYSDLTLLVGKKAFPVHKTILSARSPVFARMFNGDFKESKENRIVLEDISKKGLQELLSFIYTERLSNLEEHAYELFMVAEKYQIESLKKICGQSLCATVNTDTLLPHLKMALLYNLPELKTKCLTFFARHSTEVTLSEEWEQLIITDGNQELIKLLLQSVMRTK